MSWPQWTVIAWMVLLPFARASVFMKGETAKTVEEVVSRAIIQAITLSWLLWMGGFFEAR